jgi:pSer/pThr/pTyr-binding forkhead associated (FHA) protein
VSSSQPPNSQSTQQASVNDLRRWLDPNAAFPAAEARTPTVPTGTPSPVIEDDSQPYRPIVRPPMAMVCIRDDGSTDGEWFRIRQDSFIIGRADGDVRVPHDSQMSTRHLEIARVNRGGHWRFVVRDLDSTNGTYACVESGLLEKPNDFLIGSRRFRFELPVVGSSATDTSDRGATQAWQSITPEQLSKMAPSLVEITPRGPGNRYPLYDGEVWIGRDPKCNIVIDDPFVNRRHARLFTDAQGRWRIESGKTRNGLWVRIREIGVESIGEFQAGEQRIAVKVLR